MDAHEFEGPVQAQRAPGAPEPYATDSVGRMFCTPHNVNRARCDACRVDCTLNKTAEIHAWVAPLFGLRGK